MVKFLIIKKKYYYRGKCHEIQAKVIYSNRTIRKKYGPSTPDTIIRRWRMFCDDVNRKDVITYENNGKWYTSNKTRTEENDAQITKEKTREERRMNCKCKEKCKAEFSGGCDNDRLVN